MNYLAAHPARVLALTGTHLGMVAIALLVASAIAMPLGVYAARRPRVATWLLGGFGAIYTIPSLALLAVLVRAFGLGYAPVFIALVAYAQFMLARNVIAGIRGVDPAQVDAARGLGMSATQALLRVEFPQALPVILGGVRVAAIATIAIATLAGYVGGGGLGVLIFTGLTLHNTGMILAGSVAIAILAIAVDGTFRLLESRTQR